VFPAGPPSLSLSPLSLGGAGRHLGIPSMPREAKGVCQTVVAAGQKHSIAPQAVGSLPFLPLGNSCSR